MRRELNALYDAVNKAHYRYAYHLANLLYLNERNPIRKDQLEYLCFLLDVLQRKNSQLALKKVYEILEEVRP